MCLAAPFWHVPALAPRAVGGGVAIVREGAYPHRWRFASASYTYPSFKFCPLVAQSPASPLSLAHIMSFVLRALELVEVALCCQQVASQVD
jgi:hypothetical protein